MADIDTTVAALRDATERKDLAAAVNEFMRVISEAGKRSEDKKRSETGNRSEDEKKRSEDEKKRSEDEKKLREAKERRDELLKRLGGVAGVVAVLRKAAADRTQAAFVEGVEFGVRPLPKALVRLGNLLAVGHVGVNVLNETWGLGVVQRIDDFYRRITVDFRVRKGHQFSYPAAADMLAIPAEDHVLMQRKRDPEGIESMIRENPGKFIKLVLKSYGDMPVVRLEDVCVSNGFVKSLEWKKFWDGARAELRKDAEVLRKAAKGKAKAEDKAAEEKTAEDKAAEDKNRDLDKKFVEFPAKRAEPIRLMEVSVQQNIAGRITALASLKDPAVIFDRVRELDGEFQCQAEEKAKADAVATEKKITAEEVRKNALAAMRSSLGDEGVASVAKILAFAITAVRNVDDALYARLACLIARLEFVAEPTAETMRAYLWERKRFLKAAAALPAREAGDLVRFLGVTPEDRAKLCEFLPDLCYAAVCAIVEQFGDDEVEETGADGVVTKRYPCRTAVGALMREPQAPATLVVVLAGHWKVYKAWKELPPLITVLGHAVALGEGRQSGEVLRMQNIVRRLFNDRKWLADIFAWLTSEEKALFFERFQASISWDPATHHAIVMHMVKEDKALEAHLVKTAKKREYARVTSYRSYAQRKADYLKLINVDMPENVRKIEFAKSFGDLSENAEYQYAKDEQRMLMQRQTLMQEDLACVKPDDFASATTDEVMPGVTVTVAVAEGEKTYVILGEWDNDLERGVISSKTKLAENMLGKKVGEQFEMPGAEAGVAAFGRIVAIAALSDDIREWMKTPAGMQI